MPDRKKPNVAIQFLPVKPQSHTGSWRMPSSPVVKRLRKVLERTEYLQPNTTRTFDLLKSRRQIEKRVDALIKKVERKTWPELKIDGEGKKRVNKALRLRFKPYICEAESIAYQLATENYLAFKRQTLDFFDALVNVVACPDGRISVMSLSDPRVSYVHRVPRGQLPTRLSTSKDNKKIPSNSVLRAGVWTRLNKEKRKNPSTRPKLVTLIGPHINSDDPVHGCGGAAIALSGKGAGMPKVLGTLRFGGARNYFRTLQKSGDFYSMDNYVKIAGGRPTTIDYTHDLYSQGVIIGLGDAWRKLSNNQSLRDNLLRLHKDKEIIMSELFVSSYKNKILKIASKIYKKIKKKGKLDLRHYKRFAQNAITIGTIARELTLDEQKKGYSVLPEKIRKKYHQTALKIAVYHLLRNVVYLTLGNITPGKHWLIHHPEQLLRVGPIGADFNVRTISFIETTSLNLNQSDVQATFDLYRLMESVLPSLNIDLTREARVIMVTGGFDQTIYKDEEAVEEEYDKVKTAVIDSAAQVKMAVKRAVEEGAAVVIPMVHHTGNRSVIDVL